MTMIVNIPTPGHIYVVTRTVTSRGIRKHGFYRVKSVTHHEGGSYVKLAESVKKAAGVFEDISRWGAELTFSLSDFGKWFAYEPVPEKPASKAKGASEAGAGGYGSYGTRNLPSANGITISEQR